MKVCNIVFWKNQKGSSKKFTSDRIFKEIKSEKYTIWNKFRDDKQMQTQRIVNLKKLFTSTKKREMSFRKKLGLFPKLWWVQKVRKVCSIQINWWTIDEQNSRDYSKKIKKRSKHEWRTKWKKIVIKPDNNCWVNYGAVNPTTVCICY